jgi:hypothetical protein
LFCYVCSPFPIRLENSHVIQPSQVWVGVLSNGPSDYPLNSSFKTRETEDYKQALGNALSTRSLPSPFSSPLDLHGQLKGHSRSLRPSQLHAHRAERSARVFPVLYGTHHLRRCLEATSTYSNMTVDGVRLTDRSTSQDEQARNGSIWERMCRYKQAIIEPREAFQFKLVLIKGHRMVLLSVKF